MAQLVTGDGSGVLSVVEANHFKQLYHISLQMHAGNDASIKRHLADRLADFKLQARTLSAALAETQQRLHVSSEEATGAMSKVGGASPSTPAVRVDKRVCAPQPIAPRRDP